MSSITNSTSKILNNKYAYYVMVGLSVVNMLGYLASNQFKALILFVLIGILMFKFSKNKNKTLILLVCLITTNLLMRFNIIREGMENTTTSSTDTANVDDNVDDIDPVLGDGVKAIKTSQNKSELKAKLQQKASTMDTPPLVDPNNVNETTDTSTTEEAFQPKGAGESNQKQFQKVSNSGRIDYASTLEDAYDNLDKMLGSGGMSQLTKDTQSLMTQQKQLFDTMKTMTPMLNEAKEMLKGFDMDSISNLIPKSK